MKSETGVRYILSLCWLLFILFPAGAQEGVTPLRPRVLIVSYGLHNSEPYTFLDEGRLIGGIYKDIMDHVGHVLGIDVEYLQVPRKRHDLYMQQGLVHVIVLSTPEWHHPLADFYWSMPIIVSQDLIVGPADSPRLINRIEDLDGAVLGTILGYEYPGIAEELRSGRIIRADVNSLPQNFAKLEAGRIDYLVDGAILIRYHLRRSGRSGKFAIQPFVIDSYKLKTAISPKAPITIEELNAVYREMRENGKLQEILDRYR